MIHQFFQMLSFFLHLQIDLSFNKISFITRNTFPSDPYIPYNLKKINLSHNTIPVLTFDITFGTRAVTHLNISFNNISYIRPFVIGNMTSLRVIDLSFNAIRDLTKLTFDLPKTVTHLNLQNNYLMEIPSNSIMQTINLQVLNLQSNQFEYLDKNLVKLLKDGAQIYYAGNPLNCDCSIQPYKNFLNTFTIIPHYFKNVICYKPSFIAGKLLQEVQQEFLSCSAKETRNVEFSGADYKPLPDIQFQNIV